MNQQSVRDGGSFASLRSLAGRRTYPTPPLPDPMDHLGSTLPDPVHELLSAVQANILKGHGRDFQNLIFFQFNGTEAENRRILAESVLPTDDREPWVTSAIMQTYQVRYWHLALEAMDVLQKAERGLWVLGDDEMHELRTFIDEAESQVAGGLMLSRLGLAKLGHIDRMGKVPRRDEFSDSYPEAFDVGLKRKLESAKFRDAGADLTRDWDDPFRQPFDGVFLLASSNRTVLETQTKLLEAWLTGPGRKAVIVTAGEQRCTAFRSPPQGSTRGVPREPFGYADGISVPRFFDTERADVQPGDPIPWEWVDLMLDDVLVSPEHSEVFGHGSFVALLKFEQDVAKFRAYEASMVQALVDQAQLPVAVAKQLAEPLLTGRTRDGVPLKTVLLRLAQTTNTMELLFGNGRQPMDNPFPPELNVFDFKGDMSGSVCPFHAHIRKMNPRVDAVSGFNKASIIASQLVRRGMAYDEHGYLQAAEKLHLEGAPAAWPSTGVGLMFMAFMRDLGSQFEVLHHAWAWDTEFPSAGAGQPDPLLYGGVSTQPWSFGRVTFDPMPSCVKRLGGAYLFAPSIDFLARGG